MVLLSDLFLKHQTLVNTHCNRLVTAPNLMLILKSTMDIGSCQSWPVLACQLKMQQPTSTIASSKEKLNFQSKTTPVTGFTCGPPYTRVNSSLSPGSWSQWRGSWRCLKPSSCLCCPVCWCCWDRNLMAARTVSSMVSSTFSWEQLTAKQEPAHRDSCAQPTAALSCLRGPTWHSLKANKPSRDAAAQLPLLPLWAERLKTINMGVSNQGLHSS